MGSVLLEVCVDSLDGLAAAVAGGADRIELCAALELGGLTPSLGMMQAAAGCRVPVFAMIRPRPGDFVFGAADVVAMRADIAAARAAGCAGVVLGASQPDGRLDREVLAALKAEAAGMGSTLHRAFDLVPNWHEAVEVAVELGFERVLTSGGAASAAEGVGALERIFAAAAGRVTIMPGAGLTAETVSALRHLPLAEVHGSCSVSLPALQGFGGGRRTDAAAVRALKAALAD